MKIAIIINSHKFSSELGDELKKPELADKYNLTYDLFIKEPQEIESFLRELNHETYNACIIGGGDGTVRSAAQALIDQDIPLGILPLGTFNFLAKSLNYPEKLDDLFAMIKNNKTKQIDLGEVNNNIFINHAWIGFYYRILKLREKHIHLLGNRLLRIIFNAFNFFSVIPVYDLEFTIDNKINQSKACLVYIGNNEQYTNLLDFGDRKSLSLGLLSGFILNCKSRWSLFKCIVAILTNNFKDSQFITTFSTDNLTITAKSKLINMVIDGELFKLENPLHFTIHKKKLMVFVP